MTDVKPARLFKGTVIYTLGALLRKGVNFLLLPLYTAALAASGYGALAMLTVFGGIVTMALNCGLGSAVTVKYKAFKDKGREKEVENTVVTFLLAVGLAALVLLYLTCPLYARQLVKREDGVALVRLFLLPATMNILVEVFYVFLRLRFQNARHLTVSLLNFVASTGLIVTFVLGLKLGVVGVVLGMMLPSCCTLIYFLTTWGYRPQLAPGILSPLLRFGLWLVPGNLGALVYTFADRFFIQAYFTLADVGVYSLAVKLSGIITVFLLKPFRQAFGPYVFQGQDLHRGLDLGMKFLAILGSLGFLGVSLAAGPLVRLVAPPEFLPALTVIPVLLLVEIGNAFNQVFAVGIHRAGKSYIDSAIVWGAAGLNVALNFLLIPRYKMMGAALATLVVYIAMNAAYYYFSNKEMPYALDFRFLLRLGATTALYYFTGKAILGATGSPSLKILYYGAIMTTFIGAVYFLLDKKDKIKLKQSTAGKILRHRVRQNQAAGPGTRTGQPG